MEYVITEQELHEDRSNDNKARKYIASLLQVLLTEEGTPLTELELRIASISAMMIAQNGIVLTSLLGQIRHIEDDLNVVTEAIQRLVELNLVTYRHTRPLASEHNNVVVEFSEDFEWDDATIAEVERLTEFSYPLPSLRPAKLRTKNTDSGMHYSYTNVMAGHYLNRHDGDLNLGHLNRLGQLQFKLNHDLMNQYDEFAMMSEKSKEDALTHNDSPEDFIAESQRVYAAMGDASMSFDWFRDSRGRKYPRGYHCSPHGTQYKKQSLEFAQKRTIKLS